MNSIWIAPKYETQISSDFFPEYLRRLEELEEEYDEIAAKSNNQANPIMLQHLQALQKQIESLRDDILGYIENIEVLAICVSLNYLHEPLAKYLLTKHQKTLSY